MMTHLLTDMRCAMRACAAAAMLALWSCDVHEWPGEEPSAPETMRVCLKLKYETGDMPLFTTVDLDKTRGTRAKSDCDFRYIVNIYSEESDTRFPTRTLVTDVVESVSAAGLESPDRTIELHLPAGNYNIIAWSDYVDAGVKDDKYYNTSDMSRIKVQSADGAHPGNREEREAFRGNCSLSLSAADFGPVAADGERVKVVEADMVRPLARFRFVSTDLDEFQTRGTAAERKSPARIEDYDVVIRYAGYMPDTYNAFTDKPVDSRLGRSFKGVVKKLSDKEAELGFDHVFVNGKESMVQLALEVYERGTQKQVASSGSINVPLKRGRLTEIRGRFLTATATGGVGIEPGFNGDHNIEIK